MEQIFQYIYQVYEEGSFSKAAEKLYITQPALSIAIQKEEASIGMPLFDRTQRPLRLTPMGKIYIHTIKKAQYLDRELSEQINDIRNLNAGNIRIGGTHYLNAYILPEVLAGFSKKYPKINVELVESGSDNLMDMLYEKKIDLTFNCNPQFLPDFKCHPAFHDTILLAVPESYQIHERLKGAALSFADIRKEMHLEADCPTVSIEEFQSVEFILLSKGNNLYDRSLKLFQQAGFEPHIKMSLSQLVTSYHLAEHGIAAAFVSDRLITGQISKASSNLQFYKINSELLYRQFYIMLPKKDYTSFATEKFIDYFANFMKHR